MIQLSSTDRVDSGPTFCSSLIISRMSGLMSLKLSVMSAAPPVPPGLCEVGAGRGCLAVLGLETTGDLA